MWRCRNWVKLFLLTLIVPESLFPAASPSPVPTGKIDLKQAYESAVSKTEVVPISESSRDQLREKVREYKGAIIPHLNLNGNYLHQNNPDGSAYQALLVPDQWTAKFTLNQPLFHGLRDFAELRAITADERAAEKRVLQSKVSTYASVAQAYYTVLRAEKDRADLVMLSELTQKRIGDLKERAKIGRTRRGELLSAQAQSGTLLAQLETADNEVSTSRDLFSNLTGLPFESTLTEPPPEVPTTVPPLEHFIKKIEARPDIGTQIEVYNAADEKVASAYGAHLPTLDLTANYYLVRPGIYQDVKWDVGLAVTIPIFQGGSAVSQVREAVEKRKEQELRLAYLRRNALRDIHTYYQSLKSSVLQFRAYGAALEVAQENYKEQTHDYRFGLVTNLDVLEALKTLQETQRLSDRTFYQIRIQEALLNSAVGITP